MRCVLLCVGRMSSGPEKELVSAYLEKASNMGRQLGFKSFDVIELNESQKKNITEAKQDEANQIETRLMAMNDVFIIACDETGKNLTSTKLAQTLNQELENGRKTCVIIIGGHAGLDPTFTRKTHLKLAMGNMTWPHKLARILIAEQLYRTTTILSNHPYHRE